MTGGGRTPPTARLRVRIGALVTVLTALAAGGCASVEGPADDWSRSYVSTFDRVFEAALQSLEASEFYLDSVDAAGGRIRARSSVRRGGDLALLVRVEERPPVVRVDVMAQGAADVDGRASASMSAAVAEFLTGLDDRLEGRSD